MKKVENFSSIVLGALSILFLIVNTATIKDGHNWGGDFSQYIQHAKNILEGRPYAESYELEPAPVYPFGFPLLLLPLIKCWGVNYPVLKFPNLVYWLIFVWSFYPLMKRRLGEENALFGAIFFLTSPFLYVYKQNVLSDLPFLAFQTLAIYWFSKYVELKERSPADSRRAFLFLGAAVALIFYGSLMRLVGMALFLAMILYAWINRKDKTLIIIAVAMACASWVIQQSFGATTAYDWEEMRMPLGQWIVYSYRQLGVIFFYLVEALMPLKTVFSSPTLVLTQAVIGVVGPAMFLIIAANFIDRIRKRSVSFMACFFVVYLAVMTVWWVDQGGRYYLPIVGLAAIFVIEGFFRTCEFFRRRSGRINFEPQKVVKIVFLVLIMHNVFSIIVHFDFNDDVIYTPETKEMVAWIKEHTQPQDHLMFQRPTVLGQLTQRYGVAFIHRAADRDMDQRIEKFSIDYLIITKDANELLLLGLKDTKIAWQPVWQNSVYWIIHVRPQEEIVH